MDAAAQNVPYESVPAGDIPFNSQPPAPLPLSQLARQTALPGLSQLYHGGLLPYGDWSQGALPQRGPAPAAAGVRGALHLALPPVGPLPTLRLAHSSFLPHLSLSQAVDGNDRDGGFTGGTGGATGLAAESPRPVGVCTTRGVSRLFTRSKVATPCRRIPGSLESETRLFPRPIRLCLTCLR